MDKECPKHPGEECAELLVRCDLHCFHDLIKEIEEEQRKTREALDTIKEPE